MGNIIRKSSLIQRTSTSSIQIAAPGAGKYTCLTSLDVEGDAATTVSISGGATMLWQHGITADESFFKTWDVSLPFRAPENTLILIDVAGGNFTINLSGFVTP